MFDQIWIHEQYRRGALAPVRALGHYTKLTDIYGKPMGNIHFVGTEYATRWNRLNEGRTQSGRLGRTGSRLGCLPNHIAD